MCNKCHPFYTGEQRIVDTAGQVERFMKRVSAKEQLATPEEQAKPSKKERRAQARRMRSGMAEEPTAEAVAGAPVEVTPAPTYEQETHVAPGTLSPEAAATEANALATPEGDSRRRNRPPRGEDTGEQRQRPPRRPRGERPARPAEANAPSAGEPVQPAAELLAETPQATAASETHAEQPAETGEAPVEGNSGE